MKPSSTNALLQTNVGMNYKSVFICTDSCCLMILYKIGTSDSLVSRGIRHGALLGALAPNPQRSRLTRSPQVSQRPRSELVLMSLVILALAVGAAIVSIVALA
jgi:hypothetical protein